ncbi:MAG TPA: homoserine dehydrogenase, partial [Alphaproteobacteria bacterium]|nr:homoserine dehydrogenase [Alphaproteobacteria bacterium]
MTKPLHIAVAGLGTVGAGVVRLLAENAPELTARCGRALKLVAVSARDRDRERGIDHSGAKWFDDPVAMAKAKGIDVVVELIGGADGIARAVVEAAIAAKRAVVTANKALLAHHGTELARAAEAKGVALSFEAAVAGGIPIIKALRE